MKSFAAFLVAASCATLSACGSEPEPSAASTEAEDFAARINNGAGNQGATAQGGAQTQTGSAAPMVAPAIAPPLANAAPGAFAAGTATDPASATCNANLMGPYIGTVADSRTRVEIENVAGPGAQIRFVRPGGDYITPNPASARLNLMLDNQDIIRDARCG